MIKSKFLKSLFLFLTTVILSVNSVSATTYYSIADGAWFSNIWSTISHTGSNCSCQPSGSCTFSGTAYIYNKVTISGCTPFKMGNHSAITLSTNAKLTINSSVAMTDNETINVPSGDTLVINGDLTMSNGNADIYVNGVIIVTGTVDLSANAKVTGTGAGSYGSLSVHGGASCWCLGVLPIVLVNFNAIPDDTKILVKWTTATEINNDYFTIERSTDGETFNQIATLKGSGNSNSLLNYSFIDENPFYGISYYRLKQTDYNGTSVTYNSVVVNFSSASSLFEVFPNPNTGNQIIISYTAKNTGDKFLIYISDITGRIVFEKSLIADTKGLNTTTINPESNLSKGIYFLSGAINNNQYTKKLVVK
jgi:hypothetical protein